MSLKWKQSNQITHHFGDINNLITVGYSIHGLILAYINIISTIDITITYDSFKPQTDKKIYRKYCHLVKRIIKFSLEA